eukprot:tig00021312_g20045.t1
MLASTVAPIRARALFHGSRLAGAVQSVSPAGANALRASISTAGLSASIPVARGETSGRMLAAQMTSVRRLFAATNPAQTDARKFEAEALMDSDLGAHPLDSFFTPKSVAVAGATDKEGSVGRTVLQNLIQSPFGGTVYPVNPKRANVLGVRAYPNIKAVPEKVDLLVVCTPASQAPSVVKDAAEAGCRNVIIISAGFAEEQAGDLGGKELLAEVLKICKTYGVRLIGPNCLGVLCPISGLNASFAADIPKPGRVALLSQSGALVCSVMDWSLREGFGFSHIASIGSMADVDYGDLIDYLGRDPRVSAIVMYMEGIGDARSFFSAARRVALMKPVVVIKAGRTEAGMKAAASHTGALAGGDDVLTTAFERCGVMRIEDTGDLFNVTQALSSQPLPKGKHLTIVTNAGGPGILATDALISGGGELANVSKETIDELNKVLPAVWSHANPVDIIGDAKATEYAKTLEVVLRDKESDGVLVILTPQAMTESTATAEAIVRLTKEKHFDKPILAAWMGGQQVQAGADYLKKNKVPTFIYSDAGAKVFNMMWHYSESLKALYEVPEYVDAVEPLAVEKRDAVRSQIDKARKDGIKFLSEYESKKILGQYGIPVTSIELAKTADEAVAVADKMGYPVVVKIHSNTITHKVDVNGVQLNLLNPDSVRKAYAIIQQGVKDKGYKPADFLGVTVQPMLKLGDGYETIVGMNLDNQVGPVLLFGTGGTLVEIYKDAALALPPLNVSLARQLLQKTKIAHAFVGIRGKPPINQAAVENVLVRFSQLVLEQPMIKEIDINPLVCSPDRVIALDARVVLHDKDVTLDKIPLSAIRAYPSEYVFKTTSAAGKPLVIRPARPEDELAVASFLKREGEEPAMAPVFGKYFSGTDFSRNLFKGRIIALTAGDYNREFTLLALDGKDILAMGRLTRPAPLSHPSPYPPPPKKISYAHPAAPPTSGGDRAHRTKDADFAVMVGSKQDKALGALIVEKILKISIAERYTSLACLVDPANAAIVDLLVKSGFSIKPEGKNMRALKTF